MDIKVKDLGDAVNQLTAIENTIADIMNLLKLQKTTVTASLESKLKILSEVFYFQKPDQVEILDHVDIDLSKVSLKIQESLKNLINKYALIEMLTDLENQVKGIESNIKVNFLNDPNNWRKDRYLLVLPSLSFPLPRISAIWWLLSQIATKYNIRFQPIKAHCFTVLIFT